MRDRSVDHEPEEDFACVLAPLIEQEKV